MLCVAITLTIATSCADAIAQVPGRYSPYLAPPENSFLSALLQERLRAAPHDSPLPDTPTMEQSMLVNPVGLYSTLRPLDEGTVDASWQRALDALARAGVHMTMAEASTALRWDLGFTRARPGDDVPRVAATPRMARSWAIANMVKAGVDIDIFLKARDLVGSDDASLAAPLAVAAQLLREEASEAHASGDNYTGSWRVPLDRFMAARSLDNLGDEHISYLMRLLENELSSWRERRPSAYGLRQIPTAARIARAAAAYRSRQYHALPCHEDGSVNTSVASFEASDAARPLCFADMTDRRVLGWYIPQLFDDLAWHEAEGVTEAPGLRRLVTALARLRPGWLGAFVPAAQADALDTRVISAAIAHELSTRGAVTQSTLTALDEHAIDQMCHGSAP